MAIFHNIYAKSFDTENLGNKQRIKPGGINKRQAGNKIESHQTIINEANLQDSDRKLITVIKNYLFDILENTYNALINEIFA